MGHYCIDRCSHVTSNMRRKSRYVPRLEWADGLRLYNIHTVHIPLPQNRGLCFLCAVRDIQTRRRGTQCGPTPVKPKRTNDLLKSASIWRHTFGNQDIRVEEIQTIGESLDKAERSFDLVSSLPSSIIGRMPCGKHV